MQPFFCLNIVLTQVGPKQISAAPCTLPPRTQTKPQSFPFKIFYLDSQHSEYPRFCRPGVPGLLP